MKHLIFSIVLVFAVLAMYAQKEKVKKRPACTVDVFWAGKGNVIIMFGDNDYSYSYGEKRSITNLSPNRNYELKLIQPGNNVYTYHYYMMFNPGINEITIDLKPNGRVVVTTAEEIADKIKAELKAKEEAKRKAKERVSFTDPRDDKTYESIKIGDQVWMAENLNYDTSSGSWCYADSTSNCVTFGRLYNWQTAQNVCPSGWRLPSKSDFETLRSHVGGGVTKSYHALKDGGSSGFSALWGGRRTLDWDYVSIGESSGWWSSSGDNARDAWYLGISSGFQGATMYRNSKHWGLYVRCIQD